MSIRPKALLNHLESFIKFGQLLKLPFIFMHLSSQTQKKAIEISQESLFQQ